MKKNSRQTREDEGTIFVGIDFGYQENPSKKNKMLSFFKRIKSIYLNRFWKTIKQQKKLKKVNLWPGVLTGEQIETINNLREKAAIAQDASQSCLAAIYRGW